MEKIGHFLQPTAIATGQMVIATPGTGASDRKFTEPIIRQMASGNPLAICPRRLPDQPDVEVVLEQSEVLPATHTWCDTLALPLFPVLSV